MQYYLHMEEEPSSARRPSIKAHMVSGRRLDVITLISINHILLRFDIVISPNFVNLFCFSLNRIFYPCSMFLVLGLSSMFIQYLANLMSVLMVLWPALLL